MFPAAIDHVIGGILYTKILIIPERVLSVSIAHPVHGENERRVLMFFSLQ